MQFGPDTVVVITGASSGIGRALAREFHRRGSRLALLDIHEEKLGRLVGELAGTTGHVCDVADEDAVTAVAGAVHRAHGAVHVLINNAGVSAAGMVEEVPIAEFRRAMDVNFWGTVHACRAFLPQLRASASRGETSAIGNVLSDFALFALPTKSPYAASKHAAKALTEALGGELQSAGVRVTAVYPGATATDLVQRGFAVNEEKRAVEADFLKKGLRPEVVARRIVRGMERERSRVLIGRDTRAIDVAARLAPGAFQAAIRRLWRKVPFL